MSIIDIHELSCNHAIIDYVYLTEGGEFSEFMMGVWIPPECHRVFGTLKSFRALKLSRLENFLTLKSKTLKEYFRALKLS